MVQYSMVKKLGLAYRLVKRALAYEKKPPVGRLFLAASLMTAVKYIGP